MSISKVNGIYIVSCEQHGVLYSAQSKQFATAWNSVIKALREAHSDLLLELGVQ